MPYSWSGHVHLSGERIIAGWCRNCQERGTYINSDGRQFPDTLMGVARQTVDCPDGMSVGCYGEWDGGVIPAVTADA